MKFLYSKFLNRQDEILILRFGVQYPIQNQKALFSRQLISKYLKIDSKAIESIEKRYFRNIFKINKQPIDNNLIYHIKSSETQNKQFSLSLQQRCAETNNIYPNLNLKQSQLRKIYSNFKIKYKKVLKLKNNTKKYDQLTNRLLLTKMQDQLIQANQQGYIIIQVDESIFNGYDFQKKSWSRLNQNISIIHTSQHNHQACIIGGINSQTGEIPSQSKNGYFNQFDMIEFIQYLKRANCCKKICLFMDNCSIHKTILVQEYCTSKRILTIFNLPYQPQYNGIEILWALWKQRFRKTMLNLKMNKFQIETKNIVNEIGERISKQNTIDIAKQVWKKIFENRKQVQVFQNINLY